VPSIEHEGTSLSAIEGIVAGLPTVVSHIGGLCNIVIPGLNGLVADLAPDSLADAILQAARSRPLDEPALLAACRRALGKERWERDVWSHLTKALVLDRGAHTTGAAASRA
jgi:glycosyltransferase involved in cell wall biosynthesis